MKNINTCLLWIIIGAGMGFLLAVIFLNTFALNFFIDLKMWQCTDFGYFVCGVWLMVTFSIVGGILGLLRASIILKRKNNPRKIG